MDKKQKGQVLEILDYWKTIEFLEQKDLSIERGEKNAPKADTKSVTKEISLEIDLRSLLEKDKSIDFPESSETIGFILGKTKRNDYAAYIIDNFMEEKPNSPELPYPKNSAFGWFSLSTDLNGIYQKNTFQLSPLLWALSVWEKNKADRSNNFYLDISKYDEIIKEKDEELEEKNINDFLPQVYQDIKKKYIDPVSLDSQFKHETIGILIYSRYKDEKVKSKEEEGEMGSLADLGRSYFLKDIKLLYDKIKANEFGQASAYEKKVIDYILSAYRKSINEQFDKRTIISPNKERADEMRTFFDDTLNIQKAPMGKWPAKFMPALMQQVAVNLAIRTDDAEIPVFSVNGPPGTGKTTLLKEIVANNVVERAKLLTKYVDNPDEAFKQQSFSEGPLKDRSNAYSKFAPNYYVLDDDEINRYGMLVASCNNAAVENITVDLPKAKDILGSLQTSEGEPVNIKNGLQEVNELFDIEKSKDVETIKRSKKDYSEKDIYFTRYANALSGDNGSWGLISAPFGKKANIRKYCDKVLKQFEVEYNNNDSRNKHKEEFRKAVELFNKQVQVVERLAADIRELSSCASRLTEFPIEDPAAKKSEIESRLKQLDVELFDTKKRIIELEGSLINRLLGLFNSSSTRKEMLTELKTQVDKLVQEKQQLKGTIETIHKYEKFVQLKSKYKKGSENELTAIDDSFMEAYLSDNEGVSTNAQVTNPWFTPKYNREREKLFLYACKVHKEFCLSSKGVMHNIINLRIAWNMHDDGCERMKIADREDAMPSLLQTIFLLTPVISTTFASAQTFLRDVKKSGVLGTLIVDEAGQAQPQMAIGAMFRCRKAIIVGDPKQIEPVVTEEVDMIKQMMSTKLLSAYKDKTHSVQGFADYINPYGTYLGEGDEKEWVGSPLVVHRRCIEPMFTISNILSYDGTMKQQTPEPQKEKCATFILDKSAWIQVSGSENGNKDHFVKEQGEVVLKLLQEKIKKSPKELSLFIITPFTSVRNGMIRMLEDSDLYKNEDRIKQWMKKNIGTVHTFQGKGADEVIFLLGCDNQSITAANWVNKNIVNVAATRAKFRFYVIGDEKVWTCKPVQIAREQIHHTISPEQLDE